MLDRKQKLSLNPLYTGNTKTGTLANNENPDEMLQNEAISLGSALFAKIKTIFQDCAMIKTIF